MDEETLKADFLRALRLYDFISSRLLRSPLFLQRNIRRTSAPLNRSSDCIPFIRYASGHEFITWTQDVPRMGCLWCSVKTILYFQDLSYLLAHLRTSHGRFQYTPTLECLDNNFLSASYVLVELKLLEEPDSVSDAWGTRTNKTSSRIVESSFARIDRYTRYSSNVDGVSHLHSIPSASNCVGRYAKDPHSNRSFSRRQSASRTRLITAPSDGAMYTGYDCIGAEASSALSHYARQRFAAHIRGKGRIDPLFIDGFVTLTEFGLVCTPDGKNFRSTTSRHVSQNSTRNMQRDICQAAHTIAISEEPATSFKRKLETIQYSNRAEHAKRAKPDPIADQRRVFPSLKAAARRGILYHSVIQTRISPGECESLMDSDDEDLEIDESWRCELNENTLIDYQDTSAPEKLYMAMWNRFVAKDFRVFADRHVREAVSTFARLNGPVIAALHLEIIFLRHLTELARLGLLDASGIHSAVLAFGRAKVGAANSPELLQERIGELACFWHSICEVNASRKSALDGDPLTNIVPNNADSIRKARIPFQAKVMLNDRQAHG